MFLKQEQWNWIKFGFARGHTAGQCRQGLQRTASSRSCGKSALPYRTVAKLVNAFNEKCKDVADIHRPGRPSVSE